MEKDKPEYKIFIVYGFPQVIPYYLTPEALYEEEGITDNCVDRINYWTKRLLAKNVLKREFNSLQQKLDYLEGLYIEELVFEDQVD